MLPRAARLTREQDIMAVIRRGRKVRLPGVMIYAVVRRHAPSRIACVVGVRVDRRAVRRHRYQRWLRILARETLAQSEARRWHDMVWVAQADIVQISSLKQLRTTLKPKLTQIL